MSQFDYDLITIGAGSGGVRASRMAAKYGARVAIVEELRVGGTCVLRGCVPKKLLVYGSHMLEEIHDMAGYGWTVEGVSHDWPKLIAAKDKEMDRLNGIYLKLLAGCDVLDGRGVVIDPHTVEVAGKRYTAERIVIATGGWPTLPTFRAWSTPSPRMRRWICRNAPRRSSSSAPATLRSSSRASSTLTVSRPILCSAPTRCCAVSMKTSAPP